MILHYGKYGVPDSLLEKRLDSAIEDQRSFTTESQIIMVSLLIHNFSSMKTFYSKVSKYID